MVRDALASGRRGFEIHVQTRVSGAEPQPDNPTGCPATTEGGIRTAGPPRGLRGLVTIQSDRSSARLLNVLFIVVPRPNAARQEDPDSPPIIGPRPVRCMKGTRTRMPEAGES